MKPPPAPPAADRPTLVIEPVGDAGKWLGELIAFRELFLVLAWRDIAVRYKQTILGVAWAVLAPVATIAIMAVVFGRLARLPAEGDAPYFVLVFAGMLVWQLFAGILTHAGNSLVGNANLVSKIYFPRLLLPMAAVVVCLVDFLILGGVFLLTLFLFQVDIGIKVLLLPLLGFFAVFAAMGPALFVASLSVRYRDFRFLVPFVLQTGLYLSPVAYSSSLVLDNFGQSGYLLYSLNPMVGVVEFSRWIFIPGVPALIPAALLVSLASAVVFLIIGWTVFRKTERSFADVI